MNQLNIVAANRKQMILNDSNTYVQGSVLLHLRVLRSAREHALLSTRARTMKNDILVEHLSIKS